MSDKCFNTGLIDCFWCGESIGITIDKYAKKCENESPKHTVYDYEPCDSCKENMAKGFTIMEARSTPLPNGQKESQDGVWPTGRWWVIDRKSEFAKENANEYNKIFIEIGMSKLIGLEDTEDE